MKTEIVKTYANVVATAESVRYYSTDARRLKIGHNGQIIDDDYDDNADPGEELSHIAREYMSRHPEVRDFSTALSRAGAEDSRLHRYIQGLKHGYARQTYAGPEEAAATVAQFNRARTYREQQAAGHSDYEQAQNLLDVAANRIMETRGIKSYAEACRIALRENPNAARAYLGG